LVSPYIGSILLRLRAWSNAQYGDIENPVRKYRVLHSFSSTDILKEYEHYGFQKPLDALKVRRFSSCAGSPEYDEEERCIGDVILYFSYQDNEWIYKHAELPSASRIKDGQTARVLRLNLSNNPEWKRVLYER
jgi:hypothetical protein